jgi:hypothetical protein
VNAKKNVMNDAFLLLMMTLLEGGSYGLDPKGESSIFSMVHATA